MNYIGTIRGYTRVYRNTIPLKENQVEKNMDNEMNILDDIGIWGLGLGRHIRKHKCCLY